MISVLITAIVVTAICGLLVYVIEQTIPMAPPFRAMLRGVVVLALLVWLLWWFGVWTGPIRR